MECKWVISGTEKLAEGGFELGVAERVAARDEAFGAQALAGELSAAIRRRELHVPDAPEGSESAEPDGNQQEAAG